MLVPPNLNYRTRTHFCENTFLCCCDLVQVCIQWAPSFVCGALVLLSEVTRARPTLKSIFSSPQHSLSSSVAYPVATAPRRSSATESAVRGESHPDSNVHMKDPQAIKTLAIESYQPDNRNPKFAVNYNPVHPILNVYR